jgi:hypothetical protein
MASPHWAQSALVQHAAYGTLLREPRRALRTRIVEIIESQFAEIAESHPELLARHCTEAGLIQKAASLWGAAGQRSLERSALVEAMEQFTRALAQIETLPASSTIRQAQINLQVALIINTLMHVKGYVASETKAAVEQAGSYIQRAEALGVKAIVQICFIPPALSKAGQLYNYNHGGNCIRHTACLPPSTRPDGPGIGRSWQRSLAGCAMERCRLPSILYKPWQFRPAFGSLPMSTSLPAVRCCPAIGARSDTTES